MEIKDLFLALSSQKQNHILSLNFLFIYYLLIEVTCQVHFTNNPKKQFFFAFFQAFVFTVIHVD